MCKLLQSIGRDPVYCSWSTNNPTLIFDFCLFFVFMLILGQVRLSQGQSCPTGLRKMFSQGPSGLKFPAEARNRKNEKSKTREGGGICATRVKHGIVLRAFCKSVRTSIRTSYLFQTRLVIPQAVRYNILYNLYQKVRMLICNKTIFRHFEMNNYMI